LNHTFLAVFFLLAPVAAGAQIQALENRVASGDVTQTSAVLWARSPSTGTHVFWYRAISVPGSPWLSRSVEVADSAVPAKVQVGNLIPGSVYLYAFQTPEGDIDLGIFKTPHLPGARYGLRFGVTGDSRGDLAPYPSVANASARGLDFFVFLGDTIYADVPSPALPAPQARSLEELRTKHEEVLSERAALNALADLRSLTASFAVIDDHEVTNDFAGGAPPASDARFSGEPGAYINETPFFQAGLQAFHDFHPIAERFHGATGDPRTSGKRDLYRVRLYGSDAAVFLLDARSFRDRPLPPVADPLDPGAISDYLEASFDPTRTLLGRAQLDRLKSHLLAVETAGITWKFILVPEPIQNLGLLAASDRFEGYAAERTELLDFIRVNGIDNVVFLSADLHGTLVNDLFYRREPFGEEFPVNAFEIVTGPIAYDPPFGPSLVARAVSAGLLDPSLLAFYESLPAPWKDLFVTFALDAGLAFYGYDGMGLSSPAVNATLLTGSYVAAHVFGWTELEVDAVTRKLTVTVYGVAPYTEADVESNPSAVRARSPSVVSRFVVTPR
jgi:phosphodiesterase/alkaline phosphatase D-like protein